jgi:hypothetical protein
VSTTPTSNQHPIVNLEVLRALRDMGFTLEQIKIHLLLVAKSQQTKP